MLSVTHMKLKRQYECTFHDDSTETYGMLILLLLLRAVHTYKLWMEQCYKSKQTKTQWSVKVGYEGVTVPIHEYLLWRYPVCLSNWRG